jgi:hypothetical protein
MVSKKEITKQLKKINFNHKGWGRAEISELPNIILPDEEIYECVNGMYEGGFALLVATNLRVLLIDKKPLNYLTVEDLRFDTINEMDYNHRLFGAEIGISSGSKNLRFRSYNQPKLRKLIGHIQHCMAESKQKQSDHQDTQVSHLEQINKQLQEYLTAQQLYQYSLSSQKVTDQKDDSAHAPVKPPKPSNELSDYLYAQSLLAQHQKEVMRQLPQQTESTTVVATQVPSQTVEQEDDVPESDNQNAPTVERDKSPLDNLASQNDDIYAEGMKEIFGSQMNEQQDEAANKQPVTSAESELSLSSRSTLPKISGIIKFDINPMHIAYSKLPTALRDRKFGTNALKPILQKYNQSNNTDPANSLPGRA